MRRYYKELLLLIAVVVVTFTVCWVSHRWQASNHAIDSHSWLHEQLHITESQDAQIADVEQRFKSRKSQLEEAIHQANKELGKAILEDKQYSAKVSVAVDKIHHAQGELQKATLEHLFDMQKALSPEQAATLNRLAADALLKNP